MNNGNDYFRPRARLLLQLGDQLIRSENIAIIELAKNAYDADATVCNVICRNLDDIDTGEIVINDNGIGMTPDIIKNVWLEPGADFKDQLLKKGDQATFDFMITRPQRTPIGEKGVGRFGAHKLGDRIELVTKSSDSKNEVIITIDWTEFLHKRYLDETTFSVIERKPKIFIEGKTGTQITIKGLRKVWDKKTYRDLSRSLIALTSPFESHDDFTVNLELELTNKKSQKEWSETDISAGDIRKAALWELECTIEGSEITSFDLHFKPWKTMNIAPSHITLADLRATGRNKLQRKAGRGTEPIDLSKHNIGKVRIKAYLFDLDTSVLKLSPLLPEQTRNYLSQNGGVRVYRDNMRIYDYGEQGNDWLDLDKARINEPAKQIGNRNILGSVMLDRKASESLVEKTNREGFVDGEAYEIFRQAVKYTIDQLAIERNLNKGQMRKGAEGSSRTEPVTYDIQQLKNRISARLSDAKMDNKKEFIDDVEASLDRIQDQYIKTNEILIKSSSMGLSLGVVIHEVDKRVGELQNAVDAKTIDTERVRMLVKGIANLVDGYSALAANDKKLANLKKAIEVSLINVEFRFQAHKIEVIKAYESRDDVKVPYSMNSIVGMLLNLFDNSIYWLHAYKVEHRKIFIDIRNYDDEVGIIVADNGEGFDLAFEDALQPFVTHKAIGGIGLGLHIVDEVMKAHNGTLVLRDYKEVDGIPREFAGGAIIELLFKVKHRGSKESS